MDGVHDLGGKHGHGRIDYELDGPAFHERWEAIVFDSRLTSELEA